MQTALASLVPNDTVKKAFVRRTCSLCFDEARYNGNTPYHRRISKLTVEVEGGEQTWYMVNFWSADPAAPAGMENYRELSDANTAYLRWV